MKENVGAWAIKVNGHLYRAIHCTSSRFRKPTARSSPCLLHLPSVPLLSRLGSAVYLFSAFQVPYLLAILYFRTFKFDTNAFIMALKQIDHGSSEYLKMVNLRDNVLRRPLGLTFDHDELIAEKEDILIACIDDEDLIGCCILVRIDDTTIRLRQMAVPGNLHG